MAFHNVTFPLKLKVGSKGGRLWDIDIVETMSGAEQRNLWHANGRRVFTPEKGTVTEAEKDELVAFWNARQGRAHSFYYQDGPITEFDIESGDSSASTELVPVRFNMERFEPEAVGPNANAWIIGTLELIEVFGEDT